MHILILGAGALGSLFGARLASTMTQVSLLSTDKEHIQTIKDQGLSIEELDQGKHSHFVQAFARPQDLPMAPDLVLVLVKSYDTEQAVNSIIDFCPEHCLFLSLQNGIGNWEKIAELTSPERVLAGVTAQASTLIQPGFIRHGGEGPTLIGEPEGPSTPRVHEIVKLFDQAGLQARATEQTQKRIWEKLMVNIGINAITALTDIQNGKIVEYKAAEAIAVEAVREARYVAQACNITLAPDMPQKVLRVAAATAKNTSSMLQDVKHHKPTEIKAINQAIVQLGKAKGISTPINWTLSRLVQIIEHKNIENTNNN